jgi:hypothetical protein
MIYNKSVRMKEKTRAEHIKKNLTYYSVSQKRRKKEEVERKW